MASEKPIVGDLLLVSAMFLTFVAMVAAMHTTVPFLVTVLAMAVEMRFVFKRLPPPEPDDDDLFPVALPSKPVVVIHGFAGGNPAKWHYKGAIMNLPPNAGRKATGYANIVWYYGRGAKVAAQHISR